MPEMLRKRLGLVTAFSRKALQDIPPLDLLQSACESVHAAIDAKYVKVLERRADRDGDFLMVTGIGFDPAEYGQATVAAGPRSVPDAIRRTRTSLRIDDFSNQTEFEWPEPLRRLGIIASLNVPILIGKDVYGTLEVDSTRPTRWTDDEVEFLSSFANLLGSAIQRQRMAAARAALLKERETLLLELQHRVKNHIQLVSALLGLQERASDDADVRAALATARRRIVAVASVYSNLYRSGATIDLGEHLRQLAAALQRGLEMGRLRLEVEAIAYQAGMDVVVPISLIASELLTNALKHAELGSNPAPIRLELKRHGEGRLRLAVQDQGTLPGDFTIESHGGLGLKITQQLAGQIGGTLGFERSPICFYVIFPAKQ